MSLVLESPKNFPILLLVQLGLGVPRSKAILKRKKKNIQYVRENPIKTSIKLVQEGKTRTVLKFHHSSQRQQLSEPFPFCI
jgi:hypothetical protein